MGFVLIGVFSFNFYGLAGGFYQTLAHGAGSAGMFFLIGALYKRAKTRDISAFGGLIQYMPLLGVLFFVFALSAMAVPLTGSFVGEFLALLGSFLSGKIWVWPAALGLALSAIYTLRLYQKVFFLKASALSAKMRDLKALEAAAIAPWALLVLVMGIFPHGIFKYSLPALERL